jgi:histidinol phosphatase-like PHP family hydrolase
METLVDRTLGILNREPVDIWANPSFLPDSIAAAYDELWTRERMEKVVAALAKNDIAMEVNSRYRIPSAAFIKLARSAGVKVAFGTNNSDANIGRCEYGIAMAKECGLRWQDFFVPKSDGEKPIQRRGFRS